MVRAGKNLLEPSDSIPTSNPRRRLLMVTGIFPPVSLVGTARSVKFSKYLREFDWDCEVLAYKPRPGIDPIDESLLAQIPACVDVHRPAWLNPAMISSLFRGFSRGDRGNGSPSANNGFGGSPSANGPNGNGRPKPNGDSFHAHGGNGSRAGASIPPRHASKLASLLRSLPDNLATWLPFAVLAGKRITHRCDCIYSSAPPFTAHLVAYYLHRLTGLPLVADFRDPWIGNEELNPINNWHRRIHERWEAAVVRAARSVINVTPVLTERMMSRYPQERPGKFVTIMNGFDECDMPKCVPDDLRSAATAPAGPLTMGYFGTLYGSRTPVPLFHAVRKLLDSGALKADDLRVRLVGQCWMDVASEIRRFGLERVVELQGKQPHDRVLNEMMNTPVLLQIGAADMDGHSLSTKIFEYLAVRRPILAIVPEGPIASLVRDMNAGRVVPADRTDLIAEEIIRFHSAHRRGELISNGPCDLSLYSRRFQSGQLAPLLDAAVASSKKRRTARQ